MRALLILLILTCATVASAQTYSVTEHYPGGWQQVGAVTGPFGVFGYPVYAQRPPVSVTRTYQAAPVVEIVREPVIDSVGIVEERVTYNPWTGRYRTTRVYRGW